MAFKPSKFLSGLIGSKASASGLLKSVEDQRRLDRVALKMGKPLVDIGTPSKDFNVSGFLRGTQPPKK